MSTGSYNFVEGLRPVFHEDTALFLVFLLFITTLAIIAFSIGLYVLALQCARMLGLNVCAYDDGLGLEQAQAERAFSELSKIPCSGTCLCRYLPSQSSASSEKSASDLPFHLKGVMDPGFVGTLTVVTSSSVDTLEKTTSDEISDGPHNESSCTLISSEPPSPEKSIEGSVVPSVPQLAYLRPEVIGQSRPMPFLPNPHPATSDDSVSCATQPRYF